MGESLVLQTGVRGEYHWLTATGGAELHDVLHVCPELVIGRFVVETVLDGGDRILTPQELAAGWRMAGGIAYSPVIESIQGWREARALAGCPGYDEWYILDAPALVGASKFNGPFWDFATDSDQLLVPVTWCGFHLHSGSESWAPLEKVFWSQLDRIRPLAYLSESDEHLTFVSREGTKFQAVAEGLRELLEEA